MNRDDKKKIIADFQAGKSDTGSTAVQIAILTARIKELTAHLEKHPKDFLSRRGLLGLVGRRRRLLNYLKYHKKEEYDQLTERLELKR